MCLLVKNDGTPLGYPIVLRQTEDRLVLQLAESIKQESCHIPPDVHLSCIDLRKPDPPLPPRGSELLRAVNGLHLNEPGNERNVTLLERTLPLSQYFTPDQLQVGKIHVIAQLPLDRERAKGKSLMSGPPPAFETEITFTIPSAVRFQSLQKGDINAEEVESAPVEDTPPFLQNFYNDLVRKRCVPANSPLVTRFSSLFSQFE